MKKVYIHNDNLACIVLSKDHHNGIVIQLAVYTEALRVGQDNELVSYISTKVIHEVVVPVTSPEFKKAVSDAIQVAQHQLVQVQQKHQILDGILNDYYSQNRELNEPTKQ